MVQDLIRTSSTDTHLGDEVNLVGTGWSSPGHFKMILYSDPIYQLMTEVLDEFLNFAGRWH